MLVRDVLLQRDKLKSYIYALSRSITHCELYMHDEEMAKNLKDLKEEIEEQYKDLCNKLSAIENQEM